VVDVFRQAPVSTSIDGQLTAKAAAAFVAGRRKSQQPPLQSYITPVALVVL
jgi:hypothetical protein